MLKSESARRLARLAVCVTTVAAAVLGATGSSWASSSPIDVPAGNHLVRVVQGQGQQIYQCDATTTGGYAWTLLRPAAVLHNQGGSVFGFHTYTLNQASGQQDPTWIALDGSWVQGVKEVTLASPNGPANIPWLLLQAVASGSGTGSTLTATTYVQRTDTVGGAAPSTTCAQANAGAEQGVDYTADYSFYEAGSA